MHCAGSGVSVTTLIWKRKLQNHSSFLASILVLFWEYLRWHLIKHGITKLKKKATYELIKFLKYFALKFNVLQKVRKLKFNSKDLFSVDTGNVMLC